MGSILGSPPILENYHIRLTAGPRRVDMGALWLFSLVPKVWVVVKIMVPCWIPIIIRQLIFRVPKKGPQF